MNKIIDIIDLAVSLTLEGCCISCYLEGHKTTVHS